MTLGKSRDGYRSSAEQFSHHLCAGLGDDQQLPMTTKRVSQRLDSVMAGAIGPALMSPGRWLGSYRFPLPHPDLTEASSSRQSRTQPHRAAGDFARALHGGVALKH